MYNTHSLLHELCFLQTSQQQVHAGTETNGQKCLFNKFFALYRNVFFSLLLLTLVGCTNAIQDSSIVQTQTGFTLYDFQAVGTVYNYDDSNVEKYLGKTKETAIVPLLFKEDGTLYTKDDVEDLKLYVEGKLHPITYFTDLTTFATVTKFPYATVDYVGGIGFDEENPGYVLDPYREEQIPYTEKEKRFLEKMQETQILYRYAPYLGPTKFLECDVLVGKWRNGAPTGHTCIVYNQSSLSSATQLRHIEETETFDAWSGSVPLVDQVGIKPMRTYWHSDNIEYRYLLKSVKALSITDKAKIKGYHLAQDPDPYSLRSPLHSEDSWYCSKLV